MALKPCYYTGCIWPPPSFPPSSPPPAVPVCVPFDASSGGSDTCPTTAGSVGGACNSATALQVLPNPGAGTVYSPVNATNKVQIPCDE